jgi:hypothetical protein
MGKKGFLKAKGLGRKVSKGLPGLHLGNLKERNPLKNGFPNHGESRVRENRCDFLLSQGHL